MFSQYLHKMKIPELRIGVMVGSYHPSVIIESQTCPHHLPQKISKEFLKHLWQCQLCTKKTNWLQVTVFEYLKVQLQSNGKLASNLIIKTESSFQSIYNKESKTKYPYMWLRDHYQDVLTAKKKKSKYPGHTISCFGLSSFCLLLRQTPSP